MRTKKSTWRKSTNRATLQRLQAGQALCLEIPDSTTMVLPALFLLSANNNVRDPQAQVARLANQLIRQNRGIFNNFGITADLKYDGTSVQMLLTTGTRIGAIPLLSPTTGKPDYGMVVKPRFNWSGALLHRF